MHERYGLNFYPERADEFALQYLVNTSHVRVI